MTPRLTFSPLVAVALTLSITTSLFAQGLVNFYNDANNLVYAAGSITPPSSPITGPRDSYYFGLLIGPPNVSFNKWLFTGVYGTNTGVNGLFSGGRWQFQVGYRALPRILSLWVGSRCGDMTLAFRLSQGCSPELAQSKASVFLATAAPSLR